MTRPIKERNDLAIIDYLPRDRHIEIQEKLTPILLANPYNKYLNYDIMLGLIKLRRSKKRKQEIAYRYYRIDTRPLWSNNYKKKELLNSTKPKVVAVYREMSMLIEQFITSLE